MNNIRLNNTWRGFSFTQSSHTMAGHKTYACVVKEANYTATIISEIRKKLSELKVGDRLTFTTHSDENYETWLVITKDEQVAFWEQINKSEENPHDYSWRKLEDLKYDHVKDINLDEN